MTLNDQYNKWKESTLKRSLEKFKERRERFETSSGIEMPRLALPQSGLDNRASTSPSAPLRAEEAYLEKIGFPGDYPFTNHLDQRERESGAAHVNKPRGYTATLQKVLTIGLFAAVLLLAAVRLSLENQLFFGFGTLALLHLAGRARKLNPDWSRVGVILIGSFITLRYWMFRTTETLGYAGFWDFIFLLLLYLAETYGILVYQEDVVRVSYGPGRLWLGGS